MWKCDRIIHLVQYKNRCQNGSKDLMLRKKETKFPILITMTIKVVVVGSRSTEESLCTVLIYV